MQINTLAQDHLYAVVVGEISLVLVANFDDMKSATLKISGLKRLKMLDLDHGNEGFPASGGLCTMKDVCKWFFLCPRSIFFCSVVKVYENELPQAFIIITSPNSSYL